MLADVRQVDQNARMIAIDDKGYFITGSDTDVGKTYVACALIAQARALGREVETRKPAESGCRPGDGGALLTHDAAALREANGNLEPIERIAPHRYRAALAPHRAARLEGERLYLDQLIEACRRSHSGSCLFVEGAGGFYSPLAEDGLNADLATALGLAAIVVVDDRIGAVNQALLTVQAVASRGLRVAAVILNQVTALHEPGMDNAADLGEFCEYPIFACAHAAALPPVFEGSDG